MVTRHLVCVYVVFYYIHPETNWVGVLSQDLVIMETIKLTTETGVKTVVKPQIASFLAASVVGRVEQN